VPSENNDRSKIRAALRLLELIMRANGGKRDMLEVVQSEWRQAHSDFNALFAVLKSLEIVEVLTPPEVKDDVIVLHVKPKFYIVEDELEREDASEVHRQVTIDGEKIDLRSAVSHEIITAPVPAIESEIRTQLFNLRNAPKMKIRLGAEMRLRRIKNLRWEDITPSERAEIEQAMMSPSKWSIPRRTKCIATRHRRKRPNIRRRSARPRAS
jgi:hypothetical protein